MGFIYRLASLEKELSTVFDITVDCEGSEERRETARATLHKLETIDKERLTDILHLKVKGISLTNECPTDEWVDRLAERDRRADTKR